MAALAFALIIAVESLILFCCIINSFEAGILDAFNTMFVLDFDNWIEIGLDMVFGCFDEDCIKCR